MTVGVVEARGGIAGEVGESAQVTSGVNQANRAERSQAAPHDSRGRIAVDPPTAKRNGKDRGLFGYDKNVEAKANELTKGGTPDYVYRETKRSVASAEGKTKIYPGIGFNLPPAGTPPNAPTDDPDTIYQYVMKAYEAGANGIVVSREYEELTVPNLRAVGRAVRALRRAATGN